MNEFPRLSWRVAGLAILVAVVLASLHAKAQDAKVAGDFSNAVGDTVAEALGRATKIPFLTPGRIAEVREEFCAIVQANLDSSRVPDKDRQRVILDSLNKRIDGFSRYRDYYIPNDLYLSMPDRLKTLQFFVVESLRPLALDDADLRRLNEQREYMRDAIRAVELHPSVTTTNDRMLSEFELLCKDPFAIFLQKPMTDGQFEEFKQFLRERALDAFAVTQIAGAAVRAQYTAPRNSYVNLDLPFEDSVVGYSISTALELQFASNREFRGSTRNMFAISNASWAQAYDLRQKMPFPLGRGMRGFHADFHLDIAKKQLVGVAGTEFLPLDVKSWFAVDGISREAILKDIAAKGVETFDVAHVPAWRSKSVGPAEVFVAVLSSRGDLAVIQVQSVQGDEVLLYVRSCADKLENER
ncbi:MAG: hypothetical protein FWD53_04235 [Phycisphaerales bacterium]|nr:hypothetical protein [Phycisphaerales bacterium]